jgi:hypothetical protein
LFFQRKLTKAHLNMWVAQITTMGRGAINPSERRRIGNDQAKK